ncbi:ElyC/SanA/YdcF family protein [Lysinibacillus pakistanensis]|uniref:ElyC/SanA/YdcF family protein n=1 Tax=Lysinibacillus pakistanensis TaxID=759811 RepID=A0AAX3WXM7_9BACI|nr:ElyC/SanA/YdcF family protein [Lysinibacillus pakistanensis]MDM5230553.1 ElyC/SanA/YdcF family protein [Lysinibacillus pakistanensis]WHY46134.1 ElyC/SanA/YdcF family protein [Lysinibacillus pakistanensis]WHY51145.1 ElyC/SanA/YdcF family protein [Lysinibacillus pakistanensis]
MSFATVNHFTSIRYGPNYIIVLRSGLIGQLVVQETDEKVLEAYTMKNFMVEVYQIPTQTIIMEDQSMNTEKNMAFSKA